MGGTVLVVIGGPRRDPVCLCGETSHSFLVVVCGPTPARGPSVQRVSKLARRPMPFGKIVATARDRERVHPWEQEYLQAASPRREVVVTKGTHMKPGRALVTAT